MEGKSETSQQFNVDLTLRLGVSTNEENQRSNNKFEQVSQNAESTSTAYAVDSSNTSFPQGFLPRRASPARKRHNADADKICRGCGVVNTPLWRKGPDGPQTLCNACGLRHSRTVKRNTE